MQCVAVRAPAHRTPKAQTPTFLDPFFFGFSDALLSEELDAADFDDDEEDDSSTAS